MSPRRKGLLVAAASALLLAGCVQQSNQPTGYDDERAVENWMAGCTESGATDSYCECAYGELEESVPFDGEEGEDGTTTEATDETTAEGPTFVELNDTVGNYDPENPTPEDEAAFDLLDQIAARCEE